MTGPVLAALVALAAPAPAAVAAARAAPVRVDAAEVHYAPRRQEVVFTGAPVVLTRDDARLTCGRLVARNDDRGQIVSAICSGDVRFTRGDRVVSCATATFDNAAGRVICEGAPVILREPGSEAEGSRLTYELATDEVRLEDARVRLRGDVVEQRQREAEARRRERRQ